MGALRRKKREGTDKKEGMKEPKKERERERLRRRRRRTHLQTNVSVYLGKEPGCLQWGGAGRSRRRRRRIWRE